MARMRQRPQGRHGKVRHIVGNTPSVRFMDAYVDKLTREMAEAAKGVIPPCPQCVTEFGKADPECDACGGTGRGDY